MIAAITDMRKRSVFKQVYQFKITLEEISPSIWRRIQVPENYSFWDLHVAIQDAMGWTDSHLHMFRILNPKTREEVRIEMPAENEFENDQESLVDFDERIADYFSMKNATAEYEYDFGDGWTHKVELEGIFPKASKQKYPTCLAGERACPPEDCGGVGGYEEVVEAMSKPKHPRRDELIEWLGEKYDPEKFNAGKVFFDNPKKRLDLVQDGGLF